MGVQMNDFLNEEQLRVLENEAKDTILLFLKAIENEPVKQDVKNPTPGFAKAYEDLIMPLAIKYPNYNRWLARAVSDVRMGLPMQSPVHNHYIRIDKATEKQVLKVMLLRGTKDQVFAAAKEIKMIPADLPETDDNLATLRDVLSILNEAFGN